jgi:hypothetical protein
MRRVLIRFQGYALSQEVARLFSDRNATITRDRSSNWFRLEIDKNADTLGAIRATLQDRWPRHRFIVSCVRVK